MQTKTVSPIYLNHPSKKAPLLQISSLLIGCLFISVAPVLADPSALPAKWEPGSNPSAPSIARESTEINKLEVLLDPQSALISVHAHNVALEEVMNKISRVTGFDFKTMKADLLREPVEIKISNRPLQEVLDNLLQNYSKIFLQNDSGNLVKVLIMDKTTDTPQPLFAKKIEQAPELDTIKTAPSSTPKESSPSNQAHLEEEPKEIKKSLFAQKREELNNIRATLSISIPSEVSERLRDIRPGYPIPEELQNDPELIGYMQEYGLDSLYDLSYIGKPRGLVMRSNQNRRRFLPPQS